MQVPLTPQQLFDMLLAHYGEQHWWPADSAFEMMIGAVLTQNTSWRQVEQAIGSLRAANCLEAQALLACPEARLQQLIRPAGFFRQKARRLRTLAQFYLQHGGLSGLRQLSDARQKLLALNGIGPETADSILLYALGVPVFVIDAYSRRLAQRLGMIADQVNDYHQLQAYFSKALPSSLPLFQEFHALIVQHAKSHCRARPVCETCPLASVCPSSHHDE